MWQFMQYNYTILKGYTNISIWGLIYLVITRVLTRDCCVNSTEVPTQACLYPPPQRPHHRSQSGRPHSLR